jgi:uncharacterized protein YqeY
MLNIDAMIKSSMKEGNKANLNAYRNLKSKILVAKTAKNAKEYDDAMEISVISKYVKELTEGANAYFAADRDDLGSEYMEEADILSALLPKQPTEDEIESAVYDFIENNVGPIPENKTIAKNQMGLCIKYVKGVYPSADGKTVSEVVKRFIA